jgi:cell division protein FtsA
VPEEYCDKLLGGIILTGGGSNMKDIEKAFQNYTHIDKIRIAKFVTQTITSTLSDINARDGKLNTVLGLLAKGDINCAGEEFDPNGNLFATPKQQQTENVTERRARQAVETPAGVVRTVDEIRRADEEARRQKDEEDRIAREKAEAEERERQRIKKENSIWNKMFKGLKSFGEKVISDEE